MARSSLDSLDYCAVTLDEIALEGLDGITLPGKHRASLLCS